MPTDRRRRKEDQGISPFMDPAFRRSSIYFDDIEYQRRFEQNLIRYNLKNGAQITEEITNTVVLSSGGGGGSGHVDCYWTLEGSNIVRYGGNVGVGIHPHDNDFEVRGNVLVEAIAEQPFVEIRNWSDTDADPVIHWSLGATPVKKYTMGVDDSDSDAWLLCSGDILTSSASEEYWELDRVYSGNIALCDWGNHRVHIYTTGGTRLVSAGDGSAGSGDDEFNRPFAICNDGTYVYITDTTNHRIVKRKISDLSYVAKVGSLGSGNDEFNYPRGITTDGTYLYICDYGNNRIVKRLCSDLSYVAKATAHDGPHNFNSPQTITTDGNYLYVCQTGGIVSRIVKLTMGLAGVAHIHDDGYIDSVSILDICYSAGYLYIFNGNTGSTGFAIYKYRASSLVYDSHYLAANSVVHTEYNGGSALTTDGTHLYIGNTQASSADPKEIQVRTMAGVWESEFGHYGTDVDSFNILSGISLCGMITPISYTPQRKPILKAGLDGSYCDSYPLFRARDGFQLMEDGTVGATDYVGLYAPAAITASYSLTFPGTGPAAVGHFAVSAAGAITWGQNVGTTGSPTFVRLTSLSVATGTAPITVTSTTMCPSLNADLWDGLQLTGLTAAHVTIPGGIGTPTYDDMQDFLQMTRSAGRLTGGVVTAHAGPNGTVDISAMEGMIFTTNALGGTYIYFKQAAATAGLALTDLAVNWIYFDWNGGVPRYLATVTRSDIHEYDQFTVGRVWRSGNTVDVLATGHSLYDKDRRSHNRLILKYGSMDRASGGTLSQHTTALRIQTDAGSWYVANTAYATPAADTFKVIYKTGGSATWVEGAAVTLFSDVFDGAGGNKVYESYQNGNSIGTLSAGRYGVYWVFMSPLGVLFVVMDSVNTGSIATAQASPVPSSLPARCVNWARLVGRVICKKSDAALYSVESSFAYSFTMSAAVDHSSLANRTAVDSHPQGAITGLTTADGPTFAHIHLTDSSSILLAHSTGSIVKDTDSGSMWVNGGTAFNKGGSFQLYGETHATLPGNMYFCFGGVTSDLTGAILNFSFRNNTTLYTVLQCTALGETTLKVRSGTTATDILTLLKSTGWGDYYNSLVWSDDDIVAAIGVDYLSSQCNMAWHSFYNSGYKVDADVIMYLTGKGNLGLGDFAGPTGFGSNATNTLCLISGTAPGSSPTNAIQMYSKDVSAGNAVPHFRTENGEEISLRNDGYYVGGVLMGGGAFLDLTDVDEADYVGHEGEFVIVNAAADGLEFTASSVAAHALTSASHTDVNAGAPNDLDVLQWDATPGEWVAAPLPASAPHALLSLSHSDTTASAVSRGSIIIGNVDPAWVELVKGNAGDVLTCDGTDVAWAAPAAHAPQAHNVLSASHGDSTADTVTRGDIIIGSVAAPNTKWVRLAKGASGYALVMGADEPAWTALTVYAPTNATYIVQTASGDLSAEQALGALATGILKNTTTTGALSIASAKTDYNKHCHIYETFDALTTADINGQGSYYEGAAWATSNVGVATTTNVVVKSGADKMVRLFAAHEGSATGGGASVILSSTIGLAGGFRIRYKMRIDQDLTGFSGGVLVKTAAGTTVASVRFGYATGLKIRFYDGTTNTALMAASKDTWYQIDMIVSDVSLTTGVARIWIDGTYITSLATGTHAALISGVAVYSTNSAAAGDLNVDVDDLEVYSLFPIGLG